MKHHTAFTAPHYQAAKVGQKILNKGRTASEAEVAAWQNLGETVPTTSVWKHHYFSIVVLS